MKQPTKKELELLKKDTLNPDKWEKVESFKVGRPTSIRLPPNLIASIQKIADLRGERSYQTLLKKWLFKQAAYEMELVHLARAKR